MCILFSQWPFPKYKTQKPKQDDTSAVAPPATLKASVISTVFEILTWSINCCGPTMSVLLQHRRLFRSIPPQKLSLTLRLAPFQATNRRASERPRYRERLPFAVFVNKRDLKLTVLHSCSPSLHNELRRFFFSLCHRTLFQ